MQVHIEENLKKAGLRLTDPPSPGGSYVSVNTRGNIAFVAIQFPIKENEFLYQGRLGESIDTVEGYEAAKLCTLNILSQLNKHVGFDNIIGLNHLDIYYQQSQNWDEGPKVADGASELFVTILESRGLHTRSICGVQNLPKNFCVGNTSSFTIKCGRC